MTEVQHLSLDTIPLECKNELHHACLKYKQMNSAHEGYAVILEELDELFDEIKKKNPNNEKMRAEAIQVAAMAMRFIMDICDNPCP